MTTIDLHLHTVRSDGHDQPRAVMHACHGMRAWAITDHDTVGGWAVVRGAPGLICGVEATAALAGREVHLVGLGIDPAGEPLAGLLSHHRAVRRTRFARLLARLPAHVRRDLRAEDFAGHESEALGRSHLARAVVKRGGAASVHQVFAEHLGDEHCADPELSPFAPPEQVCAAIAGAGGVAILAHPAVYGSATNALAVADACGANLHGIELDSPRCTGELRSALDAAITARGWLVSRGSDRHRITGRPPAAEPPHPGLVALLDRLGAPATG